MNDFPPSKGSVGLRVKTGNKYRVARYGIDARARLAMGEGAVGSNFQVFPPFQGACEGGQPFPQQPLSLHDRAVHQRYSSQRAKTRSFRQKFRSGGPGRGSSANLNRPPGLDVGGHAGPVPRMWLVPRGVRLVSRGASTVEFRGSQGLPRLPLPPVSLRPLSRACSARCPS